MEYSISPVKAYRQEIGFDPDESRVITKTFGIDKVRIYKVFDRILKLSEKDCKKIMTQTIKNFEKRHIDIKRVFKDNFDFINKQLDVTIYNDLSLNKKLLIGSYFTLEYSIESAALFNPSIVPHPNQSGLKAGHQRVIISFRAVGEGHMSSIVFRTGVLDKEGSITMGKSSSIVQNSKEVSDAANTKNDFISKLKDLGQFDLVAKLLDDLLDSFTKEELDEAVVKFKKENPMTPKHDRAIDTLYWLERSNYEIEFDDRIPIEGMVIFPRSTTDIRAIEDARFVYFTQEDGSNVYYGTFTAYNGFSILPQLIDTKYFMRFRVTTLNGSGSQNKGMALFPEKINGKYAVISRNDNENIFIMFSDNMHYWENPKLLREPKYYWEFIQMGNSGSPLKTDKGWLLLTHGVGPVRTYTLGALLLDLEDPTKIIAELPDPILFPNEEERNGYVPNVVYSCGGMIHNEWLILPYAVSDTRSGIVKYKLKDLLDNMVPIG